ncbi:MAG TPA: hypothetical protein VH682_27010 [Gemmataceae bacterium]
MRYTLEYRESVRDYLRQVSLTREGRVKLYSNLIGLTAEVPDSFRSDPANRPDLSSSFYHFTVHFKDGGRWRKLFVVVDDSTVAYGVLRVVYSDCQ